MNIELVIIGITIFFIYNTYHDGKYMKMLMSWKKYYQMIFFGIIGLSVYLLLKKDPTQSKKLLLYANNVVKYMPIDRSAIDMISPIFDFTNQSSYSDSEPYGFMEGLNGMENRGEQKILNSGKHATKRSVSETKKKYVASGQDWKCGECGKQLNAWFEVDHKIRLEHGGGNDVGNLVALCRECHGQKTAMENM
jgi:hypothetical protein